MKYKHTELRYETKNVPQPFISIPVLENIQERHFKSPKKVRTFEFCAKSDGRKKVFTENDALKEYGTQKILNPNEVSYMNLFINGMLQPKSNYGVAENQIQIKTEDVPLKGTPIILYMVII